MHDESSLDAERSTSHRRTLTRARPTRTRHAGAITARGTHTHAPRGVSQVKAAYDLLLEGMETGGAGLGGAVFSAGELTAGAGPNAASYELQQRANALAQRVATGAAWQG